MFEGEPSHSPSRWKTCADVHNKDFDRLERSGPSLTNGGIYSRGLATVSAEMRLIIASGTKMYFYAIW